MKKILFFILTLFLLFTVFAIAENSVVVEPEKVFTSVELICSANSYLTVESVEMKAIWNDNQAMSHKQNTFNLNYTEVKTVNENINIYNNQRMVESITIYGFG
jgi:hypothetical protein